MTKAFAPKLYLDDLHPCDIDYFSHGGSRSYAVSLPFKDGKWEHVWITPNPLTDWNEKLGKGVLCFDIVSKRTCPNCAKCLNCYANKIETLRPYVYNKHLFNTLLLLHYTVNLQVAIERQLSRTTKRIVRLHSSGDFFAQWYVDFWADIAKKFPHIFFYGYSKSFNWVDFSEINALPNVNILNSILPDGDINYGDDDFLAEKTTQFPDISVCPVTLGIEGAECMRTCHDCWHKRFMLFKEH